MRSEEPAPAVLGKAIGDFLAPLYQAIGEVAVSCAALEAGVTDLYLALLGNTAAYVAVAGQGVEVNIRGCKAMIKDSAPGGAQRRRSISEQFSQQALECLNRAHTLGEQRNAVVHNVWLLSNVDLSEFTGVRARRATMAPDEKAWTVEQLRSLATEVWQECRTLAYLTQVVAPS
jgi:hypothetical protein